MPPQTHELEAKVTVLEHDVARMGQLFSKLDITIEKITDISNCINKMLAVHEQQIKQNIVDTEDVFHLVEKRRIEMDDNIKELHSRITTGNREMTKEMSDAFAAVMGSIAKLEEKMDRRETALLDTKADMDRRIVSLEKRQWFIMGGAAVIGFLAGNMDLLVKLFS